MSASSPTILALILGNGVIPRAVVAALVIGGGLTLVNQDAAVFGAGSLDLAALALSFTTPFVVVVVSQILGIRALLRDAARGLVGAVGDETLVMTAIMHGIPRRVFVVAAIVGTVLTAIMYALAVFDGGSQVPPAQIAQVFVLPALFGLVSQSIAYRRAWARAKPGRTIVAPS